MQLIENNVLFTQIDAEESVAANGGGTLSDLLDNIQDNLPDLPSHLLEKFFAPGS